MFDVELDIFSGRPNPRWSLTADEEAELLERLGDRTVPTAPVGLADAKLGYRGFVVRASGATAATLAARGMPTAFRVRDGLGSTIDAAAEGFLLFSAGASAVPPEAAAVVADEAAKKCRKPYHSSTTDFSDWNGSWQWDNNCYNYGANHRTDTYAQPGQGSGTGLQALTIPEVLRCAVSDGFSERCVGGKKNRTIKIWFCVWPGVDYHWYRQTKPVGGEERWCHKMGGTPARNTDDSGQQITDPRTADRSAYTSEGVFLYYKGRSNPTVI